MTAWLEAVVLLHVGSGTCAGVQVSRARVLTAYHCVAPGGRPQVEYRDGRRAAARVAGVDRARDLALLSVDEVAGTVFLPIATAPPAIGSPVHALGHPEGSEAPGGFFTGTLRWSAVEGEVSAVGERALQFSAPVNHGSSGGPLIDEQGQVVGIVSRRLGDQGLGFAGRVDAVPAELTARRWPIGAVGGTLAVEGTLVSQDGADGSLAIGARAEVALRDRVWTSAGAYAPLSGAFAAARFGATTSAVAEGLIGLRQPLGRGPWRIGLDAFAGVTALRTLRSAADDPLAVTDALVPAWAVGGRMGVRGVALELATLPGTGLVRSGLVVRWPGVLTVF